MDPAAKQEGGAAEAPEPAGAELGTAELGRVPGQRRPRRDLHPGTSENTDNEEGKSRNVQLLLWGGQSRFAVMNMGHTDNCTPTFASPL